LHQVGTSSLLKNKVINFNPH